MGVFFNVQQGFADRGEENVRSGRREFGRVVVEDREFRGQAGAIGESRAVGAQGNSQRECRGRGTQCAKRLAQRRGRVRGLPLQSLEPGTQFGMRVAHEHGIPPMRPLFVDFPDDSVAWTVEDQFLLGPDLLIAPILAPGIAARTVYLPSGTSWADAAPGAVHAGGSEVRVSAPPDRIPVFVREGADNPVRPDEPTR